ncbi:MAG: type IV fimbrial biogenesis protein FimT [Bacteroidia bacterium]|jgi:type IV fimbrial biogenesis protein FimT
MTTQPQGFTLIELITVMAVTVVLLGLGIPSFSNFIASSRSTTEYRELTKALGVARSEAITRATTVNISALSGSDWEQGYRIWIDSNTDGDYDAGEELREFASFASDADMSVTSNTKNFQFTSEGFLNADAGTEFVFSFRTSPEYCSRDRNIRLKHTGHVSVEERACP